jgi:hypothetical protein
MKLKNLCTFKIHWWSWYRIDLPPPKGENEKEERGNWSQGPVLKTNKVNTSKLKGLRIIFRSVFYLSDIAGWELSLQGSG